ncbi:Rv3654c family TadE-like protein [Thermopolyspora sp. NPDC052614]|uniref:Rv3654c family TadE-like protein n=1 Tax=Thermopolyspora sp. NPDC052614 TaxID=3155682 RepID=UPI00341E12ED
MATLWAVAAMGVMWTVVLGLLTVAGARAARHRAQAAADLSALAVAAQAVPAGQEACERGVKVAMANHARLVRCAVVGAIADVAVTMEIDLPPLGVHTVTARARAEARRQVPEVDRQAMRDRQATPA